MSMSDLLQLVGLIIAIISLLFAFLLYIVRSKYPDFTSLERRIDAIDPDCQKFRLLMNEMVYCIENIASTSLAHHGNMQYVLNRVIKGPVKDKDKIIKHLGLSAYNTKKSLLELQLLYKNGNELLSAARQLADKWGDSDTIRKFHNAIESSGNCEINDILNSYLGKLKNRINEALVEKR